MGKYMCLLVVLALLEGAAYINASSLSYTDTNSLNTNLNSLRIKTELKNAYLEVEIGEITLENRAKQARNTIAMHVHEAKVHLKSSKEVLKPNGMYIGTCVSNATEEMETLPVSLLQQCKTQALVPIGKLVAELKMLELQSQHILLYCHMNMLEAETCVEERIAAISARVSEIREAIRDEVENLRNDTCAAKAEQAIFEQLSDILANSFANCLQNELVE